jgi:PadR family transcriptional regulator PadR
MYYSLTMSTSNSAGDFEQLVLLSVVRLGEKAYGMTVRGEIEERGGRSVSLGAVYRTLQRLEDKGWVSSRLAEGGAERNRRAKRFFRVEPPGEQALRRALRAVDGLRTGLEGFTPEEV